MVNKYLNFITVFILCLVNESYSQVWSGSLSFGDKAATLYPFAQAFDKTFYPVTQLAAEYQYFEKKQHSIFQTAVFHFQDHKLLGYGLGLRSEAGYRYLFSNGFFPEVLLGIGYLGTIPSEKQFKLNENGIYKEADPLISMIEIPFTIGIGYQWKNRYSVFLRYQYSAQFPYNNTIPVVPSDNFLLGFRIKILKMKKK